MKRSLSLLCISFFLLILLGCMGGPQFVLDQAKYESTRTIGVVSVYNRLFNGANDATVIIQQNAASRVAESLEDSLGALGSWNVVPFKILEEKPLLAEFSSFDRSNTVEEYFGGDAGAIEEAQKYNQMFIERFVSGENMPIIDYPPISSIEKGQATGALLEKAFSDLEIDGMVIVKLEGGIGKGDVSVTVGERTLGDINIHAYLYVVTRDMQTLLKVESEKSKIGVGVFPNKEREIVDLSWGDLTEVYYSLIDEVTEDLLVKVNGIINPEE